MANSLVSSAQKRYVYFRQRFRKVCPSCVRALDDKRVYALCEYLPHVGAWIDRVIFCRMCYAQMVLRRIQLEARGTKYTVVYVEIKGWELPHWLVYTQED